MRANIKSVPSSPTLETHTDPRHSICLPWVWPLFAFEHMVGADALLGAQLTEEAFKYSDDILHFASEAHKLDYELKPVWATLNTTRLNLKTMLLRDFSRKCEQKVPIIIDAPYAGHSATIADFATDQSLVRTLQKNGLGHVYVTDWKSATDDMKNFNIDTYVQDLDAAVDAVGGKAHLVGICQGGWMSAAYAARFPNKVCTLVLAGAPIDTDAGYGAVKKLAHTLPMTIYQQLVDAGGGRLLGKIMLASWKSMNLSDQYLKKYVDLFVNIRDASYVKRAEEFARWYEAPLDLPGVYYLEVVEWLFKQNRLAKGKLVVLGKTISLKDITIPVYMLAGDADDITPSAQVLSASQYLGTSESRMAKKLVRGGHIGLFMGHENLQNVWPGICQWILSYDIR